MVRSCKRQLTNVRTSALGISSLQLYGAIVANHDGRRASASELIGPAARAPQRASRAWFSCPGHRKVLQTGVNRLERHCCGPLIALTLADGRIKPCCNSVTFGCVSRNR